MGSESIAQELVADMLYSSSFTSQRTNTSLKHTLIVAVLPSVHQSLIFISENTDVLDVRIGNRKYDVSFDGVLLPHTTNLNDYFFNSHCANLSSQNTERERISISGCH